MNTSRRLLVGAVLLGTALVTPVRAEVSAVTDVFGQYVRTVIYANASIRTPRIWHVSRPRIGFIPLNPHGDAAGDLLPVIAENTAQHGWPWAVWSHFNGREYNLVWSRWLGGSWSPVAPIEAVPAVGDAVDPFLAFGGDGRAYAVWLSRGTGPAEVKLSIFLATQWMAPYVVSDVGEDAADPSIALLPDGQMQVSYDTPTAHVTKIVAFARPMTITDDLTPFSNVTTSATSSSTEAPITKP